MAGTKDLNIRVKADTKQANTNLDGTAKALDNLDKEAKEATQATGGLWKEFAKGQFAVDAIKKAFSALTGIVKDAVDIFAQQELAEKRLQAALELTGESANITFKELDQIARSIQNLTTVGDEVTMEMMQLGLTMGITGDKLEQATKDTIGLSKAFGVDLNSAMKMVALARQGEFTMLQRYIPQLRSTTDATEKLAITTDVLAKGFELAKAETDTFTGKLLQIKNSFGDLQEELGRGITQSDAMSEALENIKKLLEDPEFIDSIRNIGEAIGFLIAKFIDLGVFVVNATKHLKNLASGFGTVGGALGKMLKEQDKQKKAQEDINKLLDEFDKYTKHLNLTNKEIFELINKYGDIKDVTQKYTKIIKDLNAAVAAETAARKKANEEIEKTTKFWKEAQDQVDFDIWKDLDKAMGALEKGLKDTSNAGKEQSDILKTLKEDLEAINKPILDIIDAEEQLEIKNEKLAKTFDDISDVVRVLSGVLGDDLADAIAGAASAFASFFSGDIVGGFIGLIGTFAGDDPFGVQGRVDKILQEQQRQIDETERQQAEMRAQTEAGIDEFTKFLRGGVDDAESFNAAMNITLRNFGKLAQEGKSFAEIFDIMGEQFDILGQAMKDLGIEGNDTFDKLLKWREFTNINKDLFNQIEALNNALIGMSEGGMVTTQDAFDDFQTLAIKNFDKLIKAGADEDQALLSMLPTLRTLNELQEKYGFDLDENIKRQIEFAKEKGIFDKEVGPMEEMVRLLGLLVDHFTGLAGSIGETVNEFTDLNQIAKVTGDTIGSIPGVSNAGSNIIPITQGIEGFADGGDFIARRPQIIAVGEGNIPERVQITPIRGNRGGTERVTFSINLNISGLSNAQLAAAIGEETVKGIINARRMNKLGLEREFNTG